MKVSYRIKFLDIILFNIYQWFHSPFILGFFAVLIGIITWANWQTMAERANEHSLFVLIFSFAVLELLFFAILGIVLLLTVVVGNLSKMNKTILTDCVITLHQDSISAESKYARTEYQWNAVQKLAQNSRYLFLYVMQHGAVIIPKRAFRNVQELKNFWQECQTRAKPA
jgi:hypothetical protein